MEQYMTMLTISCLLSFESTSSLLLYEFTASTNRTMFYVSWKKYIAEGDAFDNYTMILYVHRKPSLQAAISMIWHLTLPFVEKWRVWQPVGHDLQQSYCFVDFWSCLTYCSLPQWCVAITHFAIRKINCQKIEFISEYIHIISFRSVLNSP